MDLNLEQNFLYQNMIVSKLFVQRLYILTRDGNVAYDEQFHRGVNIIRGDNSSGKSTITHLLFYGLGGSYVDFVPQVKLCQYVFVEVCISDCILTLKREIKLTEDGRVETMAGMQIFWGNLTEALSGICESHYFGYKTTARQKASTGSLFMFETFDNQITRETVAELLMGVYDAELYDAKLTLRDLQKSLSETNADIKTVKEFLPRAEESSSAFLLSMINAKENEMQQLSDLIQKRRSGLVVNIPIVNNSERLKKKIAFLRKDLEKQNDKVERIKNEIDDTELFIVALEERRKALNNSIQLRKSLDNLVLEFCPECLTQLDRNVADGHCRLCKAPIDNTRGIRQAKRFDLEMSFQIQESKVVLEQSKNELLEEKSILQRLKSELKTQEKVLFDQLKDVQSPQDEEVDNMIYTKGLLEGEILQYRTMLEKATYYESLLNKKAEIEIAIEKTVDFIRAKQSQKKAREKEVNDKIREIGIYLLQHDLDRQQEFTNADDFFVDFSNNIVYLSNIHSKYSASSNFYLKIVARFALFISSLELPFMRYPRFIFADNMEDKGIEEIRAQNFQRVLFDKLANYSDDEYQVIYTTSYITKELDDSPYVVGSKYSKENKSLQNV